MRLYNLILLLLVTGLLFSDNYKYVIKHVPEDMLEELHSEGYVLNKGLESADDMKLLPSEFSYRDEFLQEYATYNPELSIEILYLIDKPEIEEGKLSLFLQENILAVSEQEGIEYFSHNRNKMYPLIKKSYYFNKNRKNIVDDPKIDELMPIRSFELFQEDTTFGGNDYTLISKLSSKDGVIWNEMINESAMRVFFVFKAIDPRGLKVSYVIIPKEDKILLYALAQIQEPPKVKEILGRKVNIPDSFRKRVDRVIQWYIKRINNKSEEKQ